MVQGWRRLHLAFMLHSLITQSNVQMNYDVLFSLKSQWGENKWKKIYNLFTSNPSVVINKAIHHTILTDPIWSTQARQSIQTDQPSHPDWPNLINPSQTIYPNWPTQPSWLTQSDQNKPGNLSKLANPAILTTRAIKCCCWYNYATLFMILQHGSNFFMAYVFT